MNTYVGSNVQQIYNTLHAAQQGDSNALQYWQPSDGFPGQGIISWQSAKTHYAFLGCGSDSRAYFGSDLGHWLILDTTGQLKILAPSSGSEAGVFPLDYATFTLGASSTSFTTGLDVALFGTVSGGLYRFSAMMVMQNQNVSASSGSVHLLNASAGAGSDLIQPVNFSAPAGTSQGCGVFIPSIDFIANSNTAALHVGLSSGTVQVVTQGTTSGTSNASVWSISQGSLERIG